MYLFHDRRLKTASALQASKNLVNYISHKPQSYATVMLIWLITKYIT